jgi:integrating conjugative element membrane protein (TIGR03747 family)
VVDATVQGLQLFALRVAVLLLSLPLFLAVAAAAVADGVYGWLIRRSAGARESGFIYHRAKRAFPSILVLMWLVYLVPPVAMDPRWAVPPFVVLFAIALRLRIAYFKKHL